MGGLDYAAVYPYSYTESPLLVGPDVPIFTGPGRAKATKIDTVDPADLIDVHAQLSEPQPDVTASLLAATTDAASTLGEATVAAATNTVAAAEPATGAAATTARVGPATRSTSEPESNGQENQGAASTAEVVLQAVTNAADPIAAAVQFAQTTLANDTATVV
jgi:hypothetical protein